MPDFLVRDPLAKGQLRTLLDDRIDAPGHFSLIWPSNRNLSPKVRGFVDFVGERLFSARCETRPQTTVAPG
ncbi:DNA-binding transcriptional regulator, LysR family (fragment) [Bosea sp. 62]